MKLKDISDIIKTDAIWICDADDGSRFEYYEGNDARDALIDFGKHEVAKLIPVDNALEIYIV